VKAASRRGIIVMNTPTGNAVTTAEHALGLLFSIARKIRRLSIDERGKWEKKASKGVSSQARRWESSLGNIGRSWPIARTVAHEHDGYDPVMTAERAAELGIELVALEELFRRSERHHIHTR